MSLIVEEKEAERLAREIAELTGTTPADAVLDALREKRAGLRPRDRTRPSVEEILEFARQIREEAGIKPGETIDHDALLYDEHGLPK